MQGLNPIINAPIATVPFKIYVWNLLEVTAEFCFRLALTDICQRWQKEIAFTGEIDDCLQYGLETKGFEDCFFDMSWLEEEEDWLSLRQEAGSACHTPYMSSPETILPASNDQPKVTLVLKSESHKKNLESPCKSGQGQIMGCRNVAYHENHCIRMCTKGIWLLGA